jgi:hypothetical protein
MIETIIHVVWDEAGNVAAHVNADDAADQLDATSEGRFRRVLALRLTLPSAEAIELDVTVADNDGPAIIQV